MTIIATTLECGKGPPSSYASYREQVCACMCVWGGCMSAHERELYFVGQRVYICNTSAMCHGKCVTRITNTMFQKSQCSFFEDLYTNLKSRVWCTVYMQKSYHPQFLRNNKFTLLSSDNSSTILSQLKQEKNVWLLHAR
jgi:hypothetical protein